MRGKIKGKTWVMYKDNNKSFTAIDNSSPLYHICTSNIVSSKVILRAVTMDTGSSLETMKNKGTIDITWFSRGF